MRRAILLLPILILLITAPTVFARGENRGNHGSKNNSRFELKIENDDDENEVEEEAAGGRFEIKGEITAISQNSFVVLGQSINIDPSKVSKFEQKGILMVGNIAKVEGIVINGTKFAQEINVIGTGQGKFKFEISGVLPAVTTPTPTPTATPSTTIGPSPTPTATPTATPTPSANVKVKIKAVGPLDQVISFIQQILSFLTNLVTPTPTPTPSPTPTPNPTPTPTPTP